MLDFKAEMIKLNAAQLRSLQSSARLPDGQAVSHQQKKKLKRNDIYIILDNVLDTYNIGAIFRLADALEDFIAERWIILPGVLCELCQEIYRNHGRKNK